MGNTGAIRQKAIDHSTLAAMEKHGKRTDRSGPQRQVRDREPLVYGSMDLSEALAGHKEGAKQSGRSACLHALVQFPSSVKINEKNEKAMLGIAVRFMNDFHGGDAVFAARLDRDEKGRHTVDVFLMPKYDFEYKDGRKQKKLAISKFSKEQAKRRYGKTDKRSQGSALQDAWFEHLRDVVKLKNVEPPKRKKLTSPDRVEPEIYALKKEKAKLKAKAEAVALKEKQVDRAIAIVVSAKNATHQPITPELEKLNEKREQKRKQRKNGFER